MSISPALAALSQYPQFILRRGKTPVSPSGDNIDPHTAGNWMSYERAASLAVNGLELGFVFTSRDPFFFVDLDKCLEGNVWSSNALNMLSHFPGAAVEVSCSGNGLHIIGKYSGGEPAHKCKNVGLKMELYTSLRYVALTQDRVLGDCATVCDVGLTSIIPACFPPEDSSDGGEWRDEPIPEWNGITDDEGLIEKACNSSSGAGIFGGKCSFRDLWECNEDALGSSYPDSTGVRGFDCSSADAALAQRLAFWTGNNHERIERLMKQSGLVRDKYEREDYLPRTITSAVSRQTQVYGERAVVAEGLPALASKSDSQRLFAEQVRASHLTKCAGDEDTKNRLSEDRAPLNTASFWLTNQTAPLEDLLSISTPIESAGPRQVLAAQRINGVQYLSADMQIEHFSGCIYVQNLHRILVSSGALLKSEQFNVTYGGYLFQLDETGNKTTRKAWDAFTESQCVRFPKVEGTSFRPGRPSQEITIEEGAHVVNTYTELNPPQAEGDPAPFLTHLEKVLPVAHDRAILLAYMSACVQHKGVKFQWAPLLQGVEGNGKTLFTRCVAAAIGRRYTHYPKAMELDSKFNGWLMNKLFIGVEDIYTAHRQEIIETLKPMITGGDGIEIQLKGADQITVDVCANFMLNSNHRDAIKKTENDRRFAVFYTAQQTAADIKSAGMHGDYFPKLYEWLNTDGYKIVSKFLHDYEIPEALNPATLCHRAPETSSTAEVIEYSLSNVDQLVLESIGEGKLGFCGGWVSSIALNRLLTDSRIKLPPNKRREMMNRIGYDWHPNLDRGRVNNHITVDAGKPRLFIKEGHLARELSSASEIGKAYEQAQNETATGGAASVAATSVFSS